MSLRAAAHGPGSQSELRHRDGIFPGDTHRHCLPIVLSLCFGLHYERVVARTNLPPRARWFAKADAAGSDSGNQAGVRRPSRPRRVFCFQAEGRTHDSTTPLGRAIHPAAADAPGTGLTHLTGRGDLIRLADPGALPNPLNRSVRCSIPSPARGASRRPPSFPTPGTGDRFAQMPRAGLRSARARRQPPATPGTTCP